LEGAELMGWREAAGFGDGVLEWPPGGSHCTCPLLPLK
jgi:hypothetical protein